MTEDTKGLWNLEPKDVAAITTALDRIKSLEDCLAAEARQLDAWAAENVTGRWSTHQVEPMRRRADEIRRVLL
jgi:hypothetical protein